MDGHSIGLLVAAAVIGIALGYAFSLLLVPIRSRAARLKNGHRSPGAALVRRIEVDGEHHPIVDVSRHARSENWTVEQINS